MRWYSSCATIHLHGESWHSEASTDDDGSNINDDEVSHLEINCNHSYMSA